MQKRALRTVQVVCYFRSKKNTRARRENADRREGPMRDFDWKVLVSLHETKNITKSAEQLFMTQPALTKRLQVIEEDLGCTIVLRSKKGVEFTPTGERVIKKAETILAAIQELRQELAAQQDGSSGSLALGVPYSYVRFVLPTLLEGYAALHLNIHVSITTALSDELVRQVQDGTLDVCFARYTVEDEAMATRMVSRDQIYAVYSKPFTVEELPKIPYIEFNKNAVTNAAIRQWWNENFTVPQEMRFNVYNADTCLSMVQHHLGYGIFPDKNYFVNVPGLYSIPLVYKDGTQFTRKTWLIHKKKALQNPIVAQFVDYVGKIDIGSITKMS